MPHITFDNVEYSYVDANETYLALEDITLDIYRSLVTAPSVRIPAAANLRC